MLVPLFFSLSAPSRPITSTSPPTTDPRPPPHLQVWDICMGAAAGSAATLISMPFDVVKTYMQVGGSSSSTHEHAPRARCAMQTERWHVALANMTASS